MEVAVETSVCPADDPTYFIHMLIREILAMEDDKKVAFFNVLGMLNKRGGGKVAQDLGIQRHCHDADSPLYTLLSAIGISQGDGQTANPDDPDVLRLAQRMIFCVNKIAIANLMPADAPLTAFDRVTAVSAMRQQLTALQSQNAELTRNLSDAVAGAQQSEASQQQNVASKALTASLVEADATEDKHKKTIQQQEVELYVLQVSLRQADETAATAVAYSQRVQAAEEEATLWQQIAATMPDARQNMDIETARGEAAASQVHEAVGGAADAGEEAAMDAVEEAADAGEEAADAGEEADEAGEEAETVEVAAEDDDEAAEPGKEADDAGEEADDAEEEDDEGRKAEEDVAETEEAAEEHDEQCVKAVQVIKLTQIPPLKGMGASKAVLVLSEVKPGITFARFVSTFGVVPKGGERARKYSTQTAKVFFTATRDAPAMQSDILVEVKQSDNEVSIFTKPFCPGRERDLHDLDLGFQKGILTSLVNALKGEEEKGDDAVVDSNDGSVTWTHHDLTGAKHSMKATFSETVVSHAYIGKNLGVAISYTDGKMTVRHNVDGIHHDYDITLMYIVSDDE